MAGFKVRAAIVDRQLKSLPTSSLTAAIGDLLELVAGATTWAKCTSTSNFFTRKAIVMETATSASNILCQEVYSDDVIEAECANSSDVAHNGDRMVLTDENTVNNTGTDNTSQTACFIQDGTVGAGSELRLVGRVIVGNGVDPDAT